MKIEWKKLPSVTGENKYFFRGRRGNSTKLVNKDMKFTILQSWLSNLWELSYGEHNFDQKTIQKKFQTSKEAMKYAESLN